ncbi:hypothetical protein CROQUDRAFT_37372 [Cronartium quercuum f. sp. fusiforme G11]|uniref:Fungal lipase-type domain-containing protein n=1 Tax=Cronartium quercuum f. sp. fusiforme G11 TaxID=708437 RepID=A0A9P6THR3_9BASI|nr:hypothetical protein CROQUDRAFT_37372 [Cronartium quercuum f. sp. fusiforme G11]
MKHRSMSESQRISDRERAPLPRKGSPFLYHDSPEWKNMGRGGEDEKNYYIRIYKHLTPLQKTILSYHASDVKAAAKERNSFTNRIAHSQTYLLLKSSAGLLVRNFLLLCGSPFAMLSRPFQTAYIVIYFGTVYSALFALNMLFITARLMGVSKLLYYLGQKDGGGWSIINWLDITLFDSKRKIFDNAKSALGSDLGEYIITPPVQDNPEIRNTSSRKYLEFNVDSARAILLMCAIVYERDTTFVKKAAEASTSKSGLDEGVLYLLKSEEPMLRLADEWGLGFISVADFRLLSGPFAGAFYNYENIGADDNPFIVLAIKGTDPEAFSECITDCACILEDCGDFLATGMAHEGFYNSLFPSKSSGERVLPYNRMIELVKMIAKTAYDHTGKKSNLMIGGHSLGAGIASLLYARLLESPEDLGEYIVLRDAYTFGTPRACDSKLASRIDYNLNKPINQGRQMWRIGNRARSTIIGDVVTRVPPGLADKREARGALKDGSYFGYAAIGTRVDLKPNSVSPFYEVSDIPIGYKVNVCKLHDEAQIEFSRQRDASQYLFPRDIVQLSMGLLGAVLPILHDHFPASYMDSLNKMQVKVGSSIIAAEEDEN